MPVVRNGLWPGVMAYLLWALFPIYFRLLERSGAVEIIAYRVICSLIFCAVLIALRGQWASVRSVLRNRRAAWMLALAGLLVTANWTLYVFGVNSGRTLDAALGYFMNPLIAALLGVVVLGERMTRIQWLALLVGTIACVVLVVDYGEVPWIGFGVALSFAVYGLLKNRVGATVPPLVGLGVETAAMAPVFIVYLGWLAATGASTASPTTPYGWLMYLAGPVTAIPLLLFAAAARSLPLVTIGMLQYIAPIGQFLIGWLVFGEPMPRGRWLGFALIWVAVLLFVAGAVVRWRRRAKVGESV